MTNATRKILVTGATGNVGVQVIRSLCTLNPQPAIAAGVRDLHIDAEKIFGCKIELIKFDFGDTTTYLSALANCDVLFLVRPPQISDTERYFRPFIACAKETGIQHIVFLSVQGVENNSIIPHHKIEKLIIESTIPYTFLRPAYFMQNFTTTLRNTLVTKRMIFLPAGNTKFTLVDVRDVGNVAAKIMVNVKQHINKVYVLTASEKLTFHQIAAQLTEVLGVNITYRSPSLINFYWTKRREKLPVAFILVMILLHYFPRFKKEPPTTTCVEELSGSPPISFRTFIEDNRALLSGPA